MKLHPRSNSQAGQESFVLNMRQYKKFGSYIEIGAFHSVDASNTYILEREYSWQGISLEIDLARTREFNKNRKNACLNVDATSFDYKGFLQNTNFPKKFDYLQVDIEPAYNSLFALIRFPLFKYRANIITFEHDKYVHRFNWLIQLIAYVYLKCHGYTRIIKDVSPISSPRAYKPFEDWYILKSNNLDDLQMQTVNYFQDLKKY